MLCPATQTISTLCALIVVAFWFSTARFGFLRLPDLRLDTSIDTKSGRAYDGLQVFNDNFLNRAAFLNPMPTMIVVKIRDTSSRATVLGAEMREFARRIGNLSTCVKPEMTCHFKNFKVNWLHVDCDEICKIPGAVCGGELLAGFQQRQVNLYNAIERVHGYYHDREEFGEEIARKRYVSADNKVTIVILEGSIPKCSNKATFYPLSDWLRGQMDEVFGSDHDFEYGLTSWSEQMRATAAGALSDTSRGHILTLPIAFTILFATVGPTAFFVLLTMPVALLATIFILVPLQKHYGGPYSWAHISPGIWVSILVAMSIDYALFILSRWREERLAGQSKTSAVIIAVQTAGKTVFLSGIILAMSFFSLLIIDTALVQQVGASCGILILICMTVNMSLIPALLILMPDFKCCYKKNGFVSRIRLNIATTVISWISGWPWCVACVRTCMSDVDDELARDGGDVPVEAYDRLEMKTIGDSSSSYSARSPDDEGGEGGPSFKPIDGTEDDDILDGEEEEGEGEEDDGLIDGLELGRKPKDYHDDDNGDNHDDDSKERKSSSRGNRKKRKKKKGTHPSPKMATRANRSHTLDSVGSDQLFNLDEDIDEEQDDDQLMEENAAKLSSSDDRTNSRSRNLIHAGRREGKTDDLRQPLSTGLEVSFEDAIVEEEEEEEDAEAGGGDGSLEPRTPTADMRIPSSSVWVKIALLCRDRPLTVILVMVLLGAPLVGQIARLKMSTSFEQMQLSQSAPIKTMNMIKDAGFNVGTLQKQYLVITLGHAVSLKNHTSLPAAGGGDEEQKAETNKFKDKKYAKYCFKENFKLNGELGGDKPRCVFQPPDCLRDDPEGLIASRNKTCPQLIGMFQREIERGMYKELGGGNKTLFHQQFGPEAHRMACRYDPGVANPAYPDGYSPSFFCPQTCSVSCNSTAPPTSSLAVPTASPTTTPPPAAADVKVGEEEEFARLFECGDDTGGWINKITPCYIGPDGKSYFCQRPASVNCQLASALLGKECSSRKLGTEVGAGGQKKYHEAARKFLTWGHLCAGTCDMCPFKQRIFDRHVVANITALSRKILDLPVSAGATGIKSIGWMDGEAVTFDEAVGLLNQTRPDGLYNPGGGGPSGKARAYRYQMRKTKSMLGSAAIIVLEPSFNSVGGYSSQWVDEVRNLMDHEAEVGRRHGVEWQLYFEGMAPILTDLKESMYESAPYYMLGAVVSVVLALTAVSFQSLTMGIRLLVTVAFSLAWVFGIMVVLLQDIRIPGAQGDGINFIVPIMIVPVLVGLTLDYDLFLLVRIHEYRLEGFSTQDATMAAMYRTSGIITVAGLIMLAAFSALITSELFVLRTIGILVASTCILDTFLVRAWLVPALLMIGVEWNWWPGKVPPVTRRCRVNDERGRGSSSL